MTALKWSLPPRKFVLAALIGVLVGFVWLVMVRFILDVEKPVHYHGTFQVWVNGEREQFDNFTFYEEVATCGQSPDDPKHRVHMHDQVNDVVHVHAEGVTWGHFFANLRYGVGDTYLQTDEGVFIEDDQHQLTFNLNGEPVETIYNRVISSEDDLIVSYGPLPKSAKPVAKGKAAHYNQSTDPAACSGGSTGAWGRFERALPF